MDRKTARHSAISTTTDATDSPNFINYNALDYAERLFFCHSGLDRLIGISGRILAKHLGPVEIYGLEKPYLSPHGLRVLNQLTQEVLEMIGGHSNKRFGPSAKAQDKFFHRPSERETFPTHLYISRWEEKKRQLVPEKKKEGVPGSKETEEDKRRKNNEAIISGNLADVRGQVYSKRAFKGVPSEHKIVFGNSGLSETETRAVGVFYMINLVWETARESRAAAQANPSDSLALTLHSGLTLFSLLDSSDRLVSSSEGGKSGDKKRRFEEATQIVEQLAAENPDLNTHNLVIRATQRIEGQCLEGERPSARWVLDKVREIRRKST
jgi:hypothetical protein